MSEIATKAEADNVLPHRQLAVEEAQFIKQYTENFASQFNLTHAQAEKQLTRGALFSIDADWQKAYQTYTPDEVVGYKIAATYLQKQSKTQGLAFINHESEVQAAFTITPAQHDEQYGLKAALLNTETRDLYERHARLSSDERSVLPELLLKPAVQAYFLREAVIEKLAGMKKITEPGDMNLANAPHPIDGLKNLTNKLIDDPVGTVGKMKDGVLDGVQHYVLTKYMSDMQGDIVKASQADSKVLVDVSAGVVGGVAGAKTLGMAVEAAKITEIAAHVLDKANDVRQGLKHQLETTKAAIALQGEAGVVVAAGAGHVGRYLDMGSAVDNVPKAGAMYSHGVDPNERLHFNDEKYGNDLNKVKPVERRPATEDELRNVKQGFGRNDVVPGYEGVIEKMVAHNLGEDPYDGVKAVKFHNQMDVKFFRHEDTNIQEISLDQALDVFKGNKQAQADLIASVKNLGGVKQVEQLQKDFTAQVQTDAQLPVVSPEVGNTQTLTRLSADELAEQAVYKANKDKLRALEDAQKQGQPMTLQDYTALEVNRQYGEAAAIRALNLMKDGKLKEVYEEFPYKLGKLTIESESSKRSATNQTHPIDYLENESARQTVLARIETQKLQLAKQETIETKQQEATDKGLIA